MAPHDWPVREAIGCLIAARAKRPRAREAHSASPPHSVRRGPVPKGPGPFCFLPFLSAAHRRRPAIHGSHHRFRWPFFNKLPRGDTVLAVAALRDADVAQQAERGHALAEATSSKLVIRSTSGVPMHSAAACQGVGGAGCARPMARLRAARHSSDGTLARGHSRSGSLRRVRLDGPGHRSFKAATRVRTPHTTPDKKGTLVELTLRGWKSTATIGRCRNP